MKLKVKDPAELQSLFNADGYKQFIEAHQWCGSMPFRIVFFGFISRRREQLSGPLWGKGMDSGECSKMICIEDGIAGKMPWAGTQGTKNEKKPVELFLSRDHACCSSGGACTLEITFLGLREKHESRLPSLFRGFVYARRWRFPTLPQSVRHRDAMCTVIISDDMGHSVSSRHSPLLYSVRVWTCNSWPPCWWSNCKSFFTAPWDSLK